MPENTATAIAHPNIALIKYWGNFDDELRIPSNDSISFNLEDLKTRTSVRFHPDLVADALTINGEEQIGSPLQRVSQFLDIVRSMSGIRSAARVTSDNNFPMGTGIASSAAAFAALAAAASQAAGLDLDEKTLSRIARRGSGSAARSVPSGYVQMHTGERETDAYAASFAPPDHWDLIDCICIVSKRHKPTGSTQGHRLASTSPLQEARVMDSTRRVEICRQAIVTKDFDALAEIAEIDSNMMHAVMMTSQPQLFYWQPQTIALMQAVREWRAAGLPAFYTIDAGPNVHIITLQGYFDRLMDRIKDRFDTQILSSKPGKGVQFLDESSVS